MGAPARKTCVCLRWTQADYVPGGFWLKDVDCTCEATKVRIVAHAVTCVQRQARHLRATKQRPRRIERRATLLWALSSTHKSTLHCIRSPPDGLIKKNHHTRAPRPCRNRAVGGWLGSPGRSLPYVRPDDSSSNLPSRHVVASPPHRLALRATAAARPSPCSSTCRVDGDGEAPCPWR